MAQTHFHRQLQARVSEDIQARGASLISGGAADLASYRYSVGYIQGMLDVLKIAEQIEQELNK